MTTNDSRDAVDEHDPPPIAESRETAPASSVNERPQNSVEPDAARPDSVTPDAGASDVDEPSAAGAPGQTRTPAKPTRHIFRQLSAFASGLRGQFQQKWAHFRGSLKRQNKDMRQLGGPDRAGIAPEKPHRMPAGHDTRKRPDGTPVASIITGTEPLHPAREHDTAVGERTAQGSVSASSIPQGMPLPVAFSRFATLAGVGDGATEKTLIAEYGENPGLESSTLCAQALGFDLSHTERDITHIPSAQFPLIGLSEAGGAFIIQRDDNKPVFHLTGSNGSVSVSAAELHPIITSTFISLIPDRTQAPHVTKAHHNPHGFHKADDKPGHQAQGSGGEQENQLLRWLLETMWRHNKGDIGHLIAAALISNLFLIALPLFIMSVYDRVVPHSAFESLQTLAIGIFVIFAADLGLRSAKVKLIDAIGLTISHKLQLNLYRQLLTLRLSKKPTSSATLTNVQGELEAICLLLPEFVTALIADTLIALVVLGIIASIGGPVVFAPLAGMILIATVIFTANWKSGRGTKEASVLKTMAAAQLGETFDALTAVKAAGAEHMLLKKYEKTIDSASVRGHEARQYGKFSHNLLAILIQATIVATLILGVLRIDAGAMTIGSLAAITILVGRGLMPVGQMVDHYCRLCSLQDVLTSALELTNGQEDTGGEIAAIRERPFRGHIRLQNISFTHENAQTLALRNVTLDIRPGEKIGLVGKNGSGKTTLLHLLPRLHTTETGIITIDDHDIRQYAPRHLRQNIGFMPQDTVLFNTSLRQNICLGNESCTDEQFQRAVYISGVHEFARRHPEGYNMPVGPRGEFLSAGERQAVGLARIFLAPKPVLLLDEPSSMLDQNAEQRLIDRMAEHLKDTSLIICTHRTKILSLVDRIIVLSNGEIVRDGEKNAVLAPQTASKKGASPDPAAPQEASKKASPA